MEISDIKGTVRTNIEPVVLVDIRTSELTLTEVMAVIADYKEQNPGVEVWLDGDAYAILSMDRDSCSTAECVSRCTVPIQKDSGSAEVLS